MCQIRSIPKPGVGPLGYYKLINAVQVTHLTPTVPGSESLEEENKISLTDIDGKEDDDWDMSCL